MATKNSKKRIIIGADHGGYLLKEKVVSYLMKKGFLVKDVGTFSLESCDYPLIGYKVAEEISLGKFKKGILICKTGVGQSIVANKLKGVRAALCNNTVAAEFSRRHNDSNVLVLGSRFVSMDKAKKLLDIWLNTEFEGGRHLRRINQIKNIEERTL
jgi:ribose 5-phosphate isomerase B